MKFTIIELATVTAMFACCLGWFVDHRQLEKKNGMLRVRINELTVETKDQSFLNETLRLQLENQDLRAFDLDVLELNQTRP